MFLYKAKRTLSSLNDQCGLHTVRRRSFVSDFMPDWNGVSPDWNWTEMCSIGNRRGERKWLIGDHMPSTPIAKVPASAAVQTPISSGPESPSPLLRKRPQASGLRPLLVQDPLLTVEDVACRLNVSKDWVWDHSSRKSPRLPVIRMGDGTLRYRASGIEAFIDERERISAMRRRTG
jgi:predicted DNA-binding transcriptional regulator AlpA